MDMHLFLPCPRSGHSIAESLCSSDNARPTSRALFTSEAHYQYSTVLQASPWSTSASLEHSPLPYQRQAFIGVGVLWVADRGSANMQAQPEFVSGRRPYVNVHGDIASSSQQSAAGYRLRTLMLRASGVAAIISDRQWQHEQWRSSQKGVPAQQYQLRKRSMPSTIISHAERKPFRALASGPSKARLGGRCSLWT